MITHRRFNNQHIWTYPCDHLTSMWILTLTTNKIFVSRAPKIMRKMTMASIWIRYPSRTKLFAWFVSYEKWVSGENCNHLRLVYLISTPCKIFVVKKLVAVSYNTWVYHNNLMPYHVVSLIGTQNVHLYRSLTYLLCPTLFFFFTILQKGIAFASTFGREELEGCS